MGIHWSEAELAEMERVDAELESVPMTPAEWRETISRDRDAARKHSKVAERRHQYYEANKDKVAERQRAYREANKDKIAERRRAYREVNKDKIAERRHQYYLRTGR